MKKRIRGIVWPAFTLLSMLFASAGSTRAEAALWNSFFVHRVNAFYPQSAKDQFMEGGVTIAVHVDKKGHVVRAQIAKSCGYGVLDEAALRAAVESRYIPSATGATYSVKYEFKIGTFQRRAGTTMMR